MEQILSLIRYRVKQNAALVSGVVALMESVSSNSLSPARVRSLLVSTGALMPSGARLVDAGAAVAAAAGAPTHWDALSPSIPLVSWTHSVSTRAYAQVNVDRSVLRIVAHGPAHRSLTLWLVNPATHRVLASTTSSSGQAILSTEVLAGRWEIVVVYPALQPASVALSVTRLAVDS